MANNGVELEEPTISREQQKLIEDFTQLYQKIGLMVASYDMYDGLMIAKHAEKRATELVFVARHHPWLMALLKRFSGTNDYLEMALGYGVMAYAMLAHHGQAPQIPMLAQLGYAELDFGEMSMQGTES